MPPKNNLINVIYRCGISLSAYLRSDLDADYKLDRLELEIEDHSAVNQLLAVRKC